MHPGGFLSQIHPTWIWAAFTLDKLLIEAYHLALITLERSDRDLRPWDTKNEAGGITDYKVQQP